MQIKQLQKVAATQQQAKAVLAEADTEAYVLFAQHKAQAHRLRRGSDSTKKCKNLI